MSKTFVPQPDRDEVVTTSENPCSGGVCGERLCGRMKRELRYFRFLAEEDLDEVAGYFECRQYQGGDYLWREGDAGNFAAFALSGRVEISKKTEFGGNPIVVGVYSRGAVVGELALLESQPRAESALALDHVDLILLSAASFSRMLAERPKLAARLLEGMLLTVARRLKRSHERLAAIF